MDFSDVCVLCLGDVMLDRFVHGAIERISPEAPIPVIRLNETREMLGGTGNVAHNIATLGGRAVLIGLVGRDSPGEAVGRLLAGVPGIAPALVASADRPTICKTRFIASQQQIVRTDEESQLALQPREAAALLAVFDAQLPSARAIILSDYGKGVLSETVVRHVIDAARGAGVPVFVDPKTRDFSRYRGATCITPNLKELALATGRPVGDEAEVTQAARQALVDADADAILATRSEKGMMLVTADDMLSVPTRAREVFDVSGAGDTVVATLALAHASGMSLAQAMHVANAAAGVVVSKRGTATVSVEEVVHELDEQDHAADHELAGLRSLEHGAGLVARWKAQGLRVGFTNGCFDIVHPGHVALLKAARAGCDRLVVALNTDASVSRLKGPTRPVNDLNSRAQVIAAIRHVDLVIGFDDPTPIALIRRLLPDVLVKGADYTVQTVVGADVVRDAGGRVLLVDLVSGQSTTAIVKRMTAAAREPAPAK